jgi:NADH-quinone oxidoreductase subunit J
MSPGTLIFAVCSVACVLGALTTVVAKNPVRGALGLLVTILGIAGLFLKLAAQFLAAIQVIVYAGAVVILFVFVLMLLGPMSITTPVEVRSRLAKAVGGGVAVFTAFAMLGMVVTASGEPTRLGVPPEGHGSPAAVGGLLFTEGLVPFELVTVLLVVAVVGAIAVARGRQGIQRSQSRIQSPKDYFGGPVHPRDAGHPLEGR